jgi:hypothetical protein
LSAVTVEALPYTIAEERDISFGGTVRIDARAVIYGEHTRDGILATAKSVVAEITAKRAVNAIGVFFYTPTADTSGGFDIASVEWAPDGEWGNADSVSTGDYSRHRYHIFHYNPPPQPTAQLSVADESSIMGVPIPVGAALTEIRPKTQDQDAYEEYKIDASRDDVIAFFLKHLPSAGWISTGRPDDTSFFCSRGNYEILVKVDDGSFFIMGDAPAEARSEFARAASKDVEPAKADQTKQENPEAKDGVEFLRVHLSELMALKGKQTFIRFGFGQGGPHHEWLVEVQAEHDAKRFGQRERIAVGDLFSLGLEYVKTRGKENDYTRFARREIEQAIGREWRTWTTADGRFKTEAKFVKFAMGTLTLEKKDGSTIEVKLDILCSEDQEFVRQREGIKPADAKGFRTWNEATGRFSVQAKFAGIIAGKVLLVKEDGSKIHVPREQLSKADNEYLDELTKK